MRTLNFKAEHTQVTSSRRFVIIEADDLGHVARTCTFFAIGASAQRDRSEQVLGTGVAAFPGHADKDCFPFGRATYLSRFIDKTVIQVAEGPTVSLNSSSQSPFPVHCCPDSMTLGGSQKFRVEVH